MRVPPRLILASNDVANRSEQVFVALRIRNVNANGFVDAARNAHDAGLQATINAASEVGGIADFQEDPVSHGRKRVNPRY